MSQSPSHGHRVISLHHGGRICERRWPRERGDCCRPVGGSCSSPGVTVASGKVAGDEGGFNQRGSTRLCRVDVPVGRRCWYGQSDKRGRGRKGRFLGLLLGRQFPGVYDLCHTFLHVHGNARIARVSRVIRFACDSRMSVFFVHNTNE